MAFAGAGAACLQCRYQVSQQFLFWIRRKPSSKSANTLSTLELKGKDGALNTYTRYRDEWASCPGCEESLSSYHHVGLDHLSCSLELLRRTDRGIVRAMGVAAPRVCVCGWRQLSGLDLLCVDGLYLPMGQGWFHLRHPMRRSQLEPWLPLMSMGSDTLASDHSQVQVPASRATSAAVSLANREGTTFKIWVYIPTLDTYAILSL